MSAQPDHAPILDTPPAFLTVQEIAARLNVSGAMVYKLVETGELPGVKIGRSVRVRPDVFDAWLESLATSGPGKR